MDQSGRRPKLLKDYAPPPYLVEEVDLDFALAETSDGDAPPAKAGETILF